jgi:hypothetical protein
MTAAVGAAVLETNLSGSADPGATPGRDPAGAQVQIDWAHFPGVIVGNEAVDLVALHMVLSYSRKEAIIWARSKDMLSWVSCHCDASSAWAAWPPRLGSTISSC